MQLRITYIMPKAWITQTGASSFTIRDLACNVAKMLQAATNKCKFQKMQQMPQFLSAGSFVIHG